MACANDVPPMQLFIRNVTLGGSGSGSVRGIELGVGTPQQIISALPGLQDLDMPVVGLQSCTASKGTEEQCAAFAGGLYDPLESSTYSQSRLGEWNGTTDDAWFNGGLIFFNDRVSFGTSGLVESLPLYMTTEHRSE
jgi:hypothetical protein